MTPETIRAVVSLLGVIVAGFIFWWNLAGRLTRIETKVDLMWRTWTRERMGGSSEHHEDAG